MEPLNLPTYNIKLKVEDNTEYIFDNVRKKYLVNTPEEWVRQNLINYLMHDLNYPSGLISVEYGLSVNTLKKRYDILIFSKLKQPLMLIECKAPNVKITQKVFNQILAYNSKIRAPFMLISNGISHFFLKKSMGNKYIFEKEIPSYNEISRYF